MKSKSRIVRQVWPTKVVEFDGFRAEWSEDFQAWTIQFQDEAIVLHHDEKSNHAPSEPNRLYETDEKLSRKLRK